MKKITLKSEILELEFLELSSLDRELIEAAKEATNRSYSPYSKFSVGAAVRLVNGIVLTGNNQENAAYPSGLCAERVTLFYANSRYPNIAIDTLAIAAQKDNKYSDIPITPCGACRQVLLECEHRYKHSIRILLYGEKGIYEIKSVNDLLPLQFVSESMDL
jgi:cytidine deaminase